MKKTLIAAAVAVLLALACMTPMFAGTYDDQFANLNFNTLATMDGSDPATNQMRGFTGDPAGAYVLGSTLQSDAKGIYRFDANTGANTGFWIDEKISFIKGEAVDDRGYIYVGITTPENTDAVEFAVLDADMKQIYIETIAAFTGEKVGVNGTAVARIGDAYKMYFVTNYGPNFIYCYDVTDPKAPKADTAFGDNGRADIKKLLGGEAEGQYVAVDTDGTVYLTALVDGVNSKGDTIAKISADGKSVISTGKFDECYGVWLKDDYVLMSTYANEESCVIVANKADFSEVARIGQMPDSSNYSGVCLINDRVYIADQGYNGGDRILVSDKITIPVIEVEAPAEETPAEPAADAPAAAVAEEAPVAQAAPAAPAPAAQTGDITAVAVLALVASIGCAAVTGKKKN
jgi:hypothetical protein